MARRRVFVEGRQSKLSFDIALFTGCVLLMGVVMTIIWAIGGWFTFRSFINSISFGILIAVVGFSLSWIVKKIERIEDNW